MRYQSATEIYSIVIHTVIVFTDTLTKHLKALNVKTFKYFSQFEL